MANHDTLTILGHAGRPAELRYTQTGKAVCTVSVAVSERTTTRDGETKEFTRWYRVTGWEGLAEDMADIQQGWIVCAIGRISASAYLGNDGKPKASIEMTAFEVFGKPSRNNRNDDYTPNGDEGQIPF